MTSASASSHSTEQPVQFGSERHLVGVLTTPPAGRNRGFALIILNAGVLHRVGPHRLHVHLARRAADVGVPALRLDLSGIGDSKSPRSDVSFRTQSVRDARAAMDLVSVKLGVNRFILFGLCSGADNSLATALEDERVFSIAVVDPISYATPQARLRRLSARLIELGGVREAARWGLSRAARMLEEYASRKTTSKDDGVTSGEETQQGREVPDRAVYEAQLRRLVDRGVQILAIFSGAMGEKHNSPNQFFEVFPNLKGRVECQTFLNANHTFTELTAQTQLIRAVVDWLVNVRLPESRLLTS